MKLERIRPTRFAVELHAIELAHLMAAARWALEADQLPDDATRALRQIVDTYDRRRDELTVESRS